MRLVLTQVLHQKAILGTGVLSLHQFKLIFADKYIYFFSQLQQQDETNIFI
jgi:hypothetical protein